MTAPRIHLSTEYFLKTGHRGLQAIYRMAARFCNRQGRWRFAPRPEASPQINGTLASERSSNRK
jgi:hypothetical protein